MNNPFPKIVSSEGQESDAMEVSEVMRSRLINVGAIRASKLPGDVYHPKLGTSMDDVRHTIKVLQTEDLLGSWDRLQLVSPAGPMLNRPQARELFNRGFIRAGAEAGTVHLCEGKTWDEAQAHLAKAGYTVVLNEPSFNADELRPYQKAALAAFKFPTIELRMNKSDLMHLYKHVSNPHNQCLGGPGDVLKMIGRFVVMAANYESAVISRVGDEIHATFTQNSKATTARAHWSVNGFAYTVP